MATLKDYRSLMELKNKLLKKEHTPARLEELSKLQQEHTEQDLYMIADELAGDKEILKLMKQVLLRKDVPKSSGGFLGKIFGTKTDDEDDEITSIVDIVKEITSQKFLKDQFSQYYKAEIKYKGKKYDLVDDIDKLLNTKDRVRRDKVNKKYKAGE